MKLPVFAVWVLFGCILLAHDSQADEAGIHQNASASKDSILVSGKNSNDMNQAGATEPVEPQSISTSKSVGDAVKTIDKTDVAPHQVPLGEKQVPLGEKILQQMVAAGQNQSFKGVFVYERNDSFMTYQIWQMALDRFSKIHTLQLDGPPIEVVSHGGRIQCFVGVNSHAELNKIHGNMVGLNFDDIKKNYAINALGTSRVAGRLAQMVMLAPHDDLRYALELHIDEASGVLLKSLLTNPKGQLLERMQYTQLHLQKPELIDFETQEECIQPLSMSSDTPTDTSSDTSAAPENIEPMAEHLNAPKSESDQADLKSSWQATWLPSGFNEKKAVLTKSPVNGELVLTQMYSDGLARFTTFIEPLSQNLTGAQVDQHEQMGATAISSHLLKTPKGEYMITVVGEIPLASAQKISASMAWLPMH